MKTGSNPEADKFAKACNAVFWSKTESQYEEQLAKLERQWSNRKGLVNYLKKWWLEKHKERIVSAWTDRVLHFGSTTTNRYGYRLC